MRVRSIFTTLAVLIAAIAAGESAHAACSWTTLTNGTPANADRVMENFDCLAPLANPHFTGDIGLGTTSPSSYLYGTTGLVVRGAYASVAYNVSGTNKTWLTYADGGDSSFRLFEGGVNLSHITVLPGGNVGLGTTSPDAPLTIKGGAPTYGQVNIYSLNTSQTSQIDLLNSNASSRAWIELNPGVATRVVGFTEPLWLDSRAASGAGYVSLQINGTEKARLANSGNFGIGTATPGQKLDVAGTIRQSGCTTATTLSANTSGDIICTPSDARLKHVYGSYDGGLREIDRLVPVRFRYKPARGEAARDFEHAGFIAQDLVSIIPQAATRQRNGYYALDTTAILAAGVNAIKELKVSSDRQAAEILRLRTSEADQSRVIQALMARVAALERRRPSASAANVQVTSR